MADPRPLVLYHGGCADGWSAAWAAWTKLGDAADYQPVSHGDDPPDVTGREVYILDFSWRAKGMLDIVTSARKLTLIDHHASAEQELIALTGCDATLSVVFDVTKCGARLAWEYFHPNEPAPFLIEIVEDRDLWKWELPESRALNAWLGVQERTFETWDTIAGSLSAPYLERGLMLEDGRGYPDQWVYDDDMDYALSSGNAILAYERAVIESHIRQATEREIAGHKVLVTNATTLVSEITGELARGRPFAATYRDVPGRGLRIWSLRSREGGIDVSEIARSLGGGGHRAAAGFQEELK